MLWVCTGIRSHPTGGSERAYSLGNPREGRNNPNRPYNPLCAEPPSSGGQTSLPVCHWHADIICISVAVVVECLSVIVHSVDDAFCLTKGGLSGGLMTKPPFADQPSAPSILLGAH